MTYQLNVDKRYVYEMKKILKSSGRSRRNQPLMKRWLWISGNSSKESEEQERR